MVNEEKRILKEIKLDSFEDSKVDWDMISEYQKLGKKFIVKEVTPMAKREITNQQKEQLEAIAIQIAQGNFDEAEVLISEYAHATL